MYELEIKNLDTNEKYTMHIPVKQGTDEKKTNLDVDTVNFVRIVIKLF